MIMNSLIFFCALLTAAASLVLVLHPEYEDGFVGRVGLSLICVSAFARAMLIAESGFAGPDLSPVATSLWFGLSLFLTRHFYRFLRWRHSGDCDWRETNYRATAGKARPPSA